MDLIYSFGFFLCIHYNAAHNKIHTGCFPFSVLCCTLMANNNPLTHTKNMLRDPVLFFISLFAHGLCVFLYRFLFKKREHNSNNLVSST